MQLQSAWSRMHTYIQVGVALTSILPLEIYQISIQRMKARNALLVSRVSIHPHERSRTFRKTVQRYTLFQYAQRKWGKILPPKAIFCSMTFLRVVFPKHENVPIWHQNHKQASIAEESGWGFSTGIYLFFRDAMGVGKIM